MKIVVNRLGRLGNNLFQYFFAKILSEELNSDFSTNFVLPDLFGLENKYSDSIGSSNILREDWRGTNELLLMLNTKLINQNLDDIIQEIKKINPEILVLNGYFQNYNYYERHEQLIKNSFKIDNNFKDNTLGIHIRKDDIINSENELEDEWYIKMIEKFPNHDKIITTDSPNHPLVIKLLNEGCRLYDESPEKTIIEFSNFSDLILSQGTFSWWIGFLSEGKKHNLIPQRGWNRKNSPIKLLLKKENWLYYEYNQNNYELI